MPKDDDVSSAIGSLAESPPPANANEAPDSPGPSPNKEPKIQRPKSRPNVGIGAEPPIDENNPNAPMPSNDATEVANELVRRVKKWPDLGNLHGLDIHIIPLDGSSPRLLGKIGFGEVMHDDVCAGEVLRSLVTERFHRSYGVGKGSVTYECNFHWRKTGAWMSRGNKLYLGPITEIDRFASAGVGEPPPPPPPDPYAARRPVYQPSPAGFGAPPGPAPAPPGLSPEMNLLMDRMSRQEGALAEVMGFLREERAALRAQAGLPPAAPAPTAPAAPAPAPGVGGIEDMVARGVVAGLKAAGVAALGGVPPAPPPPNQPAPKDPIVSEIETVIVGALREGVKGIGKTLTENFRHAIAGVGAPPPPQETEAEEPPEPVAAEPIPAPPFHVTDTGSKWQDGRPVVYAQDAEGNMDLKGILFSNPVLIEKGLLGTAEKLADGFKDFMSKVTLPNGTQVVSSTPRGAVDGTPRPGAKPAQPSQGVGEAPHSPNAPPSPPPPRQGGGRGFPEG